ncbi:MAG: Bordetella phage vB BbrM [Pseudomonadota bacterium]|jgi:DNA modification methylase
MNFTEFGDCREIMRDWKRECIKAQTCVTSPPYFGLRDYGHDGQIGLESTPEAYIAAMVEVFRCVRDVLADDGTLWLNIGDSYAGSGGAGGQYKPGGIAKTGTNAPSTWSAEYSRKPVTLNVPGCKPKDLIGIPWMLAFALRADGWYLRQDIIWHKPNPMPESVRDRCTKAHEYIFLLSKSEKYFFDSEAMREPSADPEGSAKRYKSAFGSKKNEALLATDQVHTRPIGMREFDGKRNRRSVWTVNTKSYKGAHFATFPPALIEPCILAGSRPGDVVLDPFMGSGTTAAVAIQHGRQYLGCELNEDYWPLQEERIRAAGVK